MPTRKFAGCPATPVGAAEGFDLLILKTKSKDRSLRQLLQGRGDLMFHVLLQVVIEVSQDCATQRQESTNDKCARALNL
jgi:hypothetical protein